MKMKVEFQIEFCFYKKYLICCFGQLKLLNEHQ